MCAMFSRDAQGMCELIENRARANGYPDAKANCTTCDTDGCNGSAQKTDETNNNAFTHYLSLTHMQFLLLLHITWHYLI